MKQNFEVLGLSAADLAPSLARALARSGATALLDLEHAGAAARVTAHFQQLVSSLHGGLGLRVTSARVALANDLLRAAPGRPLTLILSAPKGELARLAAALESHPNLRLLAEITAAEMLAETTHGFHGIVALGHEGGGWAGEDTSFILLQKLAGKTSLPVYARGGVGVRSAAACRAAGAAGLVLDDQLLLLAESPLPETLKTELGRLNGAEPKLYGELLEAPCRAYARPGSPALKATEEELRRAEGGQLPLAQWRAQLSARLGWSLDGTQLLPLGQAVGLASTYRTQFGTVALLVRAIRRAATRQLGQAADLASLDEGAPLAASHNTRYPLVQGPMTRVSDVADFAVSVARGGALPLLALALMRGPQVAQMLADTKARIGGLPWGVGMLGFVPHALREEQCQEIWKCKPDFALIAGGRPDQAAEFESRGIATYIHAPAPALLHLYLEQGARRFVFEGRECGGHVGPLASFALWEQMIEVLLADVKPGEESQVHVLFAGGIHDALSAAMVAAMTAPLAARGMKVGALMGTAYLFTKEIVADGAVVSGFQEQALLCQRTMNLETGPGHASRCVDTKFAHEFYETRRRLIGEGKTAEEIRDTLEDLNLGRLRIASKGVNRDAGGKIVEVSAGEQLDGGMYMIGQVATMQHATQSIEQLHDNVCHGSTARLEQMAEAAGERPVAKPSDIAIVGIGTLLPKADGPDKFWHNVLHKNVAIGEVPAERWDTSIYFDADRSARDKVYSKWGGFIDEVPFDPTRYGIPPKSMKSIDPMQLLTLEVARRTLADAGYADGGYDRENTSIILGAGGGLGDLGLQYGVRAELPRFVENPDPGVWERLPEWTEESFAGTLLNVAAGRVANRMDFGGLNFTIDAACASSLAAISVAVNELESGRSAMVLAGGIDTVQSPFGYLCFSKTQALSPTGKPKTFDEGADGIAISEGLAVIALKRLADAECDGDRIYAVIKAVSGSSDGKALGLTAPRPDGQIRAIKRAYAKAGFSPSTLGLFEAHGTGTPVGDRAEAETITRALKNEGTLARSVALGSVKTILGHTKASAGVSGLIKVALSLYHRVQPGHHGVEKPIAAIADPASPVALLKDARPWIAHPQHPRRGGVSAFGFGGTNFHAVLEEHGAGRASSGADRWPYELCLFRAENENMLAQDLEQILPALAANSRVSLAELALTLARRAQSRAAHPLALALVAADHEGVKKDVLAALAHLRESKPLPPHIRLNRTTPAVSPQTAFLFPGQGAQYVGMGREAALYFDEVREAFEFADRALIADFPGLLSRLVMPGSAYDIDTEKAQATELTRTRVAQPAIGTLSLGYLRLARRLGMSAGATAGHSYGEYTALCAAGVIGEAELLKLSAIRGAAMEMAAQRSVPGTMAAIQGERAAITAALGEFAGVRVANHNGPQQSVISGPKDAVTAAAAKLETLGMRATLLPVSGAFHTDLVAAAQEPLTAAIRACDFHAPQAAVYSNTSGKQHPEKPAAIASALEQHLLNSVEFVSEIEAMYAAGCRIFIELGPKSLASNMAKQVLAGQEHVAVSLDGNGGGMRGVLLGLAELYVSGLRFDALQLFAGRELAAIECSQLAERAAPVALPNHMWMISGGAARPITDPVRRTGREPALTKAALDAARSKVPAALPAPAAPAVVQAPAMSPQPPVQVPLAAAQAMSSDALVAYQQTMRQFLALQEKVMQQMLGGAAASVPAIAPVFAAPASVAVAAPQPVPAEVAAAAPVAIAAAVVAAVPAFDAKSALLNIVCERTGYPADMLGPDADMEADLGIDSIKRVEILGALRKALPAAQSAAMQASMEKFTKARSLNAILAELAKLAPVAAPAVAAPAVAVAVAVALDYSKLLVGIVAERTGYPSDMLAMDADLEADLGVDSIKRVEILGALRKTLPAELSAAMQSTMERFTKARSLSAILAELAKLGPAPAPVAVAAATVAAPAPAVALDFAALLTGVVAERTGYPADMLAMDADLEADLGVDSIKRVEILGALRKILPAAQSAAMQASMEKFTKAKSLKAIVAECRNLGGSSAPVVAAPLAAIASPIPAISVDVRQLLVGIVAERTGYPPEMLSATADLESDLGIDSIKRVEILGALRKALPADMAAAMQASMERYTKARTLDAIVASFADAPKVAATTPAPAAPIAAVAPAPMVEAARTPRFVIKTQPLPLGNEKVALSGLALVFGGPAPIVQLLKPQLVARGLVPVCVDAIDAGGIAKAVAQAQEKHGPAKAVLHLQGLQPESPESLGDWQKLGERVVYSLFHAAKSLDEGLNGCRVIAGTRLGGTFGRDAVGSGAPLAGGACGITNCLRYEYPSANIRCVDFDGQTQAEIAELLVTELCTEDHASEAGYIGRERFGSVTELQQLAPNAFAHDTKPQPGWVLLVTGGARGITAEIMDEVAVEGLRLVLIGRTPEPLAEPIATRELKTSGDIRKYLAQTAMARGDKPKPVEIDRAVAALLTEREIRDTLARLRGQGCIVDYLACDVRDEKGFGALIDSLYEKHGRIDGVIHGAGVIEDRLIRDKTQASFARVFGTKLDPVFVLQQKLKPENLKFLALFASVAGRYGNRGQSDYAAANEALNRVAWSLSRAWPQTRVMAINWGPWDAGMASDAVKKQFRERGIEPISVAAGRRFFLEELEYGSRNHVELVAGDGPWAAVAATPPAVVPTALSVPLVRGDLRLGPGGSMTLDHVFSLANDPYLADHKLDGKPVLPATGALEWIAQFVAAAWPTWQVSEVRDMRALNGIVLDGTERAVQLRARASTHSDPGEQAVTVEIVDTARKLPCYRATVILTEQLALASEQQPEALTASKPFDVRQAYREFLFHGPKFQLLQSIPGVSAGGIDAMSNRSSSTSWLGRDGGWLFDPGLLDVAPQLAIVWARINQDKTALPSRFGRVRRFAGGAGGALQLSLRVRAESTEHSLVYDALYRDSRGLVVLMLEDIEGTMSGALNRLAGQAAT